MRHAWLLLLLLPIAGAEPGIQNPVDAVPVTLFLHIDGPQDIAMNPLAPPANHTAEHPPSALGSSVCLETPAQGFTGVMHHTSYAFVAPVPTQYDEGLLPPAHRGILADLHLPAQEVKLHYFVTQPRVPVSPDFVLQATLREGDDISVDHAAMDAGTVIAQARTEPATLSPSLQGHPDVRRHDDGVYEIVVTIPVPEPTTVPVSDSFNLRLDMWMDNPHCTGEQYVMPDTVAAYTSPAHRPRLELQAERVVRIDRLAVTLRDGELHFDAIVAPVFGSADAILRDDALRIEGPVQPQNLTLVAWNGVTGQRAFPPPAAGDGRLHALRTWGFAQDDATGLYTVTLSVETESGARAAAQVPFELGRTVRTCSVLPTGEPTCALHTEAEKRSPGLGGLSILALAALGLRRR